MSVGAFINYPSFGFKEDRSYLATTRANLAQYLCTICSFHGFSLFELLEKVTLLISRQVFSSNLFTSPQIHNSAGA
jgi:hypothetical protein